MALSSEDSPFSFSFHSCPLRTLTHFLVLGMHTHTRTHTHTHPHIHHPPTTTHTTMHSHRTHTTHTHTCAHARALLFSLLRNPFSLSTCPCRVRLQIRVGEKARVARSLSGLVDAESLRNRERVSEILKLHAHNELEANKIIEEMAADDDDA